MGRTNELWKPDQDTKKSLEKLYGPKPRKHQFGNEDKKWRKVRRLVLKAYGRICMRCGSRKKIHVDHIKPKYHYPELKYSFSNLQVLCEKCNSWKGLRVMDFRRTVPKGKRERRIEKQNSYRGLE